jgi:hypothetical protein
MELCPDNDISGGRILWVGTRKVKCRAATALRMASQSLHHSKSALGDFYRRMRTKLGAPKAITAAAHKLARIIFHLITTRRHCFLHPACFDAVRPPATSVWSCNAHTPKFHRPVTKNSPGVGKLCGILTRKRSVSGDGPLREGQ